MRTTKKQAIIPSLAMAALLFLSAGFSLAEAAQAKAKYVFFFIGDGMSLVQVSAAETYLSSKDDPVPPGAPSRARLAMSKFPVVGLATTFGNNSYIPDSADAGTALACGKKTNSGIIAMDPTGTVPYTSIASLAKSKGMKVGIVSSVSIDHATPAVFYANQKSRSDYYEISMQMANSPFDYFGGGGIKYPTGKDGLQPSVQEAAIANGFAVATDRESFDALKPGQKAIAYAGVLDADKALYYDIDRQAQTDKTEHITLAEYTRKGIELLENPDGFFMMVEGGKIDWACHANDARTTIDDTIAMSKAVETAVAFARKHPKETLIVVTGDHETGGLTVGFAGTQSATYFEILKPQNKSYIEFNKDLAAYKAAHATPPADIDSELKIDITNVYGLVYDELSDYQKELLEAAYDRSMAGAAQVSAEKDFLLYGGYEALTVTLTHILNQRAGIGWTSYAHTGVPVPVYARGAGESLFAGFYDNTDVAKRVASVMGVKLPN